MTDVNWNLIARIPTPPKIALWEFEYVYLRAQYGVVF